ncbi:hypothetical protein [Desertivirga xinjiangensis]|uniref:hypothetical protein n=1 Tax=Desertivirga xinjiangensis TaxID=539206 RepID=UPI00210B8E3D|nr:hypothetical protein [Pedobacter xinjiangensis]
MFILFKRHGKNRHFKKYYSYEAMDEEITKGHNEAFPGNNQFWYNSETKCIDIINKRLSPVDCQDDLNKLNLGPNP